jgi:transcriptional regulator with XRE-family HTH domain
VDICDELRRARLAAGLTQRELAALAGTSQATVSAYESGRKQPSVATLGRLLAACGRRLQVAAPLRPDAELSRAGRHLAEALTLAQALPFHPRGELRYPRLAA